MMIMDKYRVIKEKLRTLTEKYIEMDSTNLDEVNKILDRIILDFDTSGISPDIILTRALYENEVDGTFQKGKFVIRPTIKYNLSILDVKNSFVIINNKDFFKNFIDNMIDWVITYTFYLELQGKLAKLNGFIFELLNNINFPYVITFSLGEGITDISDDSIELGLSSEVISKIDNLGFFSTDELWKMKYIEKFINVLKECNRPYDIVKIKSDITKELDIYSRKSINKLLRKFVSRKIDYVRVGVGYAEDENSFALIERIAVTPSDVNNYDIDSVILVDNEYPTAIEKKKGLTKIITKYKLMPFEKKTNVMIDIGLRDYLDMVSSNNVNESECEMA